MPVADLVVLACTNSSGYSRSSKPIRLLLDLEHWNASTCSHETRTSGTSTSLAVLVDSLPVSVHAARASNTPTTKTAATTANTATATAAATSTSPTRATTAAAAATRLTTTIMRMAHCGHYGCYFFCCYSCYSCYSYTVPGVWNIYV